jgi:hypothetical protein
MNKHFEDAWYYLGRAADHLRIGLEEELEPFLAAVQDRVGEGDEAEAEPTGFDRVRTEFKEVRQDPVGTARERYEAYRGRRPAE